MLLDSLLITFTFAECVVDREDREVLITFIESISLFANVVLRFSNYSFIIHNFSIISASLLMLILIDRAGFKMSVLDVHG